MAENLTTYDPAEDLATDDAIALFTAQAFDTNDAGYIAHALGGVACAKGMAQIAGQTGLSREQLYRSFSEHGNPTLKTTLAVMKALGIELTAKVPAAAALSAKRYAATLGADYLGGASRRNEPARRHAERAGARISSKRVVAEILSGLREMHLRQTRTWTIRFSWPVAAFVGCASAAVA